jgi:hypothetical protein
MTITNTASPAIPALTNAVIENIIFPNLSLPELGACSRVCKIWRELAKKHINAFSHPHAFGAKEWYTYFRAHLRNVPRLPSHIAEILNSPCPFWPDKKVHETHVLVLVPQTVNGKPLTLRTLGELVKKPSQGNATKYRGFSIGQYQDQPAPVSRWVLMTRDVIEGSRKKSYKDLIAHLAQRCHEKQVAYEVPRTLDATVCIFMEYVRSMTQIYSQSPFTYTRCQEKYDAEWQLLVGGFGINGLDVSGHGHDYESRGVGASKVF